MRVDFGLIMGIVLEYILMIYYANTTFYPKNSYLKSSLVSLVGYTVLLCVNIVGYPLLSVITFFIINFVLLFGCYNVGYKTALLTSMLLDVLSIIGEYMILFILNINYSITSPTNILPYQSVMLTISSKLIYFIGLFIIKRSMKKSSSGDGGSLMVLLFIPIITIVCLTITMYANMSYQMFWTICIMLLAINVITFAVDEIVRNKNIELQQSKDENTKYKLTITEYQLVSKQYENMQIMKHDYKNQMKMVDALVSEDNVLARKYLKELQEKYKENSYTKYTNNVILNILLLQEIKKCREKNINIRVNSTYGKFDFLAETDTVAIFSNLIENAVEACEKSDKKYIFIDLYATNEAFPSIKIENSADIEPRFSKGKFKTQKNNTELHGFGIKSICKSIERYKGTIDWSYNKVYRYFRTIIVFNP